MKEISGDTPLSPILRIKYLVRNLVVGVWGYRRGFSTSFWGPSNLPEGRETLSRKYIDGFLTEQLPQLLPQRSIRVLDLGCGSGYVRELLYRQGYVVEYVGLDVYRHPRFDSYGEYASSSLLIQRPIEEADISGEFDLVISMESLEHMKNDTIAVGRGLTVCRGVELYTLPSFWSLFLYLWHGYRQYAPAHLRELFGANNGITGFRLGGAFSFFTHFLFSTVPSGLLGMNAEHIRSSSAYRRAERFAWRMDRFLPIMSSIYVVVRTHES